MPKTRTIQRSFAGGEMSPAMFARVDDVKFQNGFASGTRNMLVRPNGVASRRPGFRHVARVKDSSKLTRLIPFTFSVDQTILIEMGETYFRWHSFGTPLRYATPRIIDSVTTGVGSSSIKFIDPHGWAGGEQIQFVNSAGVQDQLPEPILVATTYTATVVDAKTITIALDLTAAADSTSYAYLDSEIPTNWFVSLNFAPGDVTTGVGTSQIAEVGHGFATGDPVRFTSSGTLPEIDDGNPFIPNVPISLTTTYYIIVVNANAYQIASTLANALAGTELDFGTQGSGTHTAHRRYIQGDLVYWQGAGHGTFYCIADVSSNTAPPGDTAHWYLMPRDGVYEIPHPYLESELVAVGYDQSNDVITMTHRNHAVRELRRFGALRWTLVAVSFAPELPAPVATNVVETFGEYQRFTANNGSPTVFRTTGSQNNGHGFLVGDSVYVEQFVGGIGNGVAFDGYVAGFYEVAKIAQPAAGEPFIDLNLRRVDGGAEVNVVNDDVFIRFADLLTDITHSYKVTAVTEDGLESLPSNTVASTGNNLTVPGSSNLVQWTAVSPQPSRYNVYKKKSGVYGFIGKVDGDQTTEFKDDDIAPDLGRTTPIFDTTIGISAGDSPAAVARFDQRHIFAGSTNRPDRLWATRVGTEADVSYHIPLQDDDRLRFDIASKESVSIRHLVPLKRLIVMTQSGEFQIVPVNSEVLTPSTIEVRANSYEGSSVVRPAVMASNVLFCANRGGHVFELGETPSGDLSKPGDLCLRSEHLFEDETLLDQSSAKAPYPIDWFCSSSGLLLGLTYIPQEQVGAWHSHDTGASGFFESVCVTAEGGEDAVYTVVRRTINGATVRSVERMAEQHYDAIEDAYFVDAGGTFDGRSADGSTMKFSGGTYWTAGESVTIESTPGRFVLGSGDVGDHVAVRANATGTWYRARITSVTSFTIATGVLLQDTPAAVRGVALATWAFARDTINLSHLEGEIVQVLADGLVHDEKEVISGVITLDTPGIVVNAGLAMTARVKTLPVGLQVLDAWGQDRELNVNKATLRILESSEFRIGPTEADSDLVPANTEAVPGMVITGKVDTTLLPDWQPGGEIVAVQDDPLPLTVLGIVLEVSIGGG